MSLIDFKTKLVNYDLSKTSQNLAMEYYNKNKNSLRFHIGDSVKVDVPFNAPTSLRKTLKDKVFEIVGVDIDYNFDNLLSYVLNTGTDITLFKDKNLIEIN